MTAAVPAGAARMIVAHCEERERQAADQLRIAELNLASAKAATAEARQHYGVR